MAISGAKKLSTKNAAILFRQVVISELIAIEEDKNLFAELWFAIPVNASCIVHYFDESSLSNV